MRTTGEAVVYTACQRLCEIRRIPLRNLEFKLFDPQTLIVSVDKVLRRAVSEPPHSYEFFSSNIIHLDFIRGYIVNVDDRCAGHPDVVKYGTRFWAEHICELEVLPTIPLVAERLFTAIVTARALGAKSDRDFVVRLPGIQRR